MPADDVSRLKFEMIEDFIASTAANGKWIALVVLLHNLRMECERPGGMRQQRAES